MIADDVADRQAGARRRLVVDELDRLEEVGLAGQEGAFVPRLVVAKGVVLGCRVGGVAADGIEAEGLVIGRLGGTVVDEDAGLEQARVDDPQRDTGGLELAEAALAVDEAHHVGGIGRRIRAQRQVARG